MARAGQTEQVSEMVDALSVFFRISLSRGRTFITVKEELRHVENYIMIQKKRYEKYLDYEIEAEESILGCQCLKMILQPLVENSIYHGIKEKGVRGLIRITAVEKNGTILFRVTDTGQGMTQEKLQELQEMMQKGIEYDANAYGVINVQRRIQTYFGKGYGLHFQSVYGEGTEVTVVIPKREIQEDLNELESSDRRG
jgi:two-component system sensor histidine kinase YesM